MPDQFSDTMAKPAKPVRRRQHPVKQPVTRARAVAFALLVLIGVLGIVTIAAMRSEHGLLSGISAFTTRAFRGRTDPEPVEYFNAGLDKWVSATVHSTGESTRFGSGDWSCGSTGAEPGVLRIWQESLDLNSYDISFHARLNVKAIGWAFRATDAGTFYGMKITVAGPGHGGIAHLERFVRVRGRELARSSVPLPMSMDEGTECHVQVKVRGSRFTTLIDGQTVDSWSDKRLKTGGIGFFSEAGESSTIAWVKLVERGTLAGRVAGLFALASGVG